MEGRVGRGGMEEGWRERGWREEEEGVEGGEEEGHTW